MTYTVCVADGKLAIRWPRRDEVVLDAVGGDRFIGSLGTVTFTRAACGGINGLTISNRRLRRLRADRVVVEHRDKAGGRHQRSGRRNHDGAIESGACSQ